MRPVSVYANGSDCEIEQLKADLHGRERQATRAVMVLSLHGLPPAQIAVLLDCHPATVRRWTSPWLPPGYEQNFWNAALAQMSADRCGCGCPRGSQPQEGRGALEGLADGMPRQPGLVGLISRHLPRLPAW
jgi:hypothetical protein